MTLVAVMAVATAVVRLRREPRRSGSVDCAALWRTGVELEGVVGGRKGQAYFDMAAVAGSPGQVSGLVMFSGEPRQGPLADSPTGLKGPLHGDGCGVQLQENGDGAEASIWRLRMESAMLVTGTRRLADGREESVAFTVVSPELCDGAGEWRMFDSPGWPIRFDYPADWVLTADQDDVNLECPSVTGLAAGGSWLTFERGWFPPAGRNPTVSRASFSEPYWFIRLATDDWRVSDAGRDRDTGPAPGARCVPARRSERHGITVLQGAAGEHRLYRAGVGYLGQGGGITRYLFLLRDQWVSLDSAVATGHYDDIGDAGGPVLLEGDGVGERVVRSIRPR